MQDAEISKKPLKSLAGFNSKIQRSGNKYYQMDYSIYFFGAKHFFFAESGKSFRQSLLE